MAKCTSCGSSTGTVAGRDMWYCHNTSCLTQHCDTCGGLSHARKAGTAGIGFTATCKGCGQKMKKKPPAEGGDAQAAATPAEPKEPGWLDKDVKPEDMKIVGEVVAAIAETKTGKSIGVLGAIPIRFALLFVPFLGPFLLIKGHQDCPWYPTLERWYWLLVCFPASAMVLIFFEIKRSSFDFEAVWAAQEAQASSSEGDSA